MLLQFFKNSPQFPIFTNSVPPSLITLNEWGFMVHVDEYILGVYRIIFVKCIWL